VAWPLLFHFQDNVCVKICVLFAVSQFAFSIASRPTQFTYDFNVSFFILDWDLTFLELLCSVL
jgi:hypothetical protein